MNRALFLLHRYLGVGLGLLISVWCLSGIVMMYVQYPDLSVEEQLAGLEPLDVRGCCLLPAKLVAREAIPLGSLYIEMQAGRPVIRSTVQGVTETIDLRSGAAVERVSQAAADAVADSYAQRNGLPDAIFEEELARDQWTVYGAYDRHRPLYRYSASDPAGTVWYVSSRTGAVIQSTTASERFWNWLGAVPHWLYPTLLRQHTYLWSQIVIWSTIAALFLTVFGLYVGIRQFKARRSGRLSPYRGCSLWHHYAGLVFGIFTLTWLVSGLFSMNPWGTLEGRSFAAEAKRHRGGDLVLDTALQQVVTSLSTSSLPLETVRLEAGVLNGERYFLAWNSDGDSIRLDASLESTASVPDGFFRGAASAIRPGVDVSDQGWIAEPDDYYYSHHEERQFPVYRITYADGERYYLDSNTGTLVYAVDSGRKLYRWIHYGLHRGDFSAFFRSRPIWDLFMLLLMGGVTTGALTGTWMGFRRLQRWLKRSSGMQAQLSAAATLRPIRGVRRAGST